MLYATIVEETVETMMANFGSASCKDMTPHCPDYDMCLLCRFDNGYKITVQAGGHARYLESLNGSAYESVEVVISSERLGPHVPSKFNHMTLSETTIPYVDINALFDIIVYVASLPNQKQNNL